MKLQTDFLHKENLQQLKIKQYAKELCQNSDIAFSLHMLEDEKIEFPYEDADVFRQGSCQLFAFALHEKYGYPVYKLQINLAFHIFCKSPDGTQYIDVRGITSDFHAFIEELNVPNIDVDCSQKYEWEADDFTGEFDDIGLAFARALIKAAPERYQNDNRNP